MTSIAKETFVTLGAHGNSKLENYWTAVVEIGAKPSLFFAERFGTPQQLYLFLRNLKPGYF